MVPIVDITAVAFDIASGMRLDVEGLIRLINSKVIKMRKRTKSFRRINRNHLP